MCSAISRESGGGAGAHAPEPDTPVRTNRQKRDLSDIIGVPSDQSDRTVVEIRDGRLVLGTVLYLLTRDVEVYPPAHPIDPVCPFRGDNHGAASNPIARVHEQIPDSPRVIVHNEVVDVANLAVQRLDVIPDNFPGASQMLLFGCP